MGSNIEKEPWTNLQNSYENWSKEIKSDNFCYRKVGKAMTKWGAIKKSLILLSQYWKNCHFERVTKIISHFEGSNYSFADCNIRLFCIASHPSPNYCNCNSYCSYTLLKNMLFLLLPLRTRKNNKNIAIAIVGRAITFERLIKKRNNELIQNIKQIQLMG